MNIFVIILIIFLFVGVICSICQRSREQEIESIENEYSLI